MFCFFQIFIFFFEKKKIDGDGHGENYFTKVKDWGLVPSTLRLFTPSEFCDSNFCLP